MPQSAPGHAVAPPWFSTESTNTVAETRGPAAAFGRTPASHSVLPHPKTEFGRVTFGAFQPASQTGDLPLPGPQEAFQDRPTEQIETPRPIGQLPAPPGTPLPEAHPTPAAPKQVAPPKIVPEQIAPGRATPDVAEPQQVAPRQRTPQQVAPRAAQPVLPTQPVPPTHGPTIAPRQRQKIATPNQDSGPTGPLAPSDCLPLTHHLGFAETPTVVEPTWQTVCEESGIYDAKFPVPTEYPWIQWGREFYDDGMVPVGGTRFSQYNLTHPTLYMYGDYRMGVGMGRNAAGDIGNLAMRLNLDIDLQLTATERFHAFIGPFNRVGQFFQADFSGRDLEVDAILNLNPVTGFFEGDIGYILGGLSDRPADFELPISVGLMPLFYQNGIWMDDAVAGIAVAQNAKHSRLLRWSNFDATAFAIFDQLNSPAFGNDNHAALAVGTAWFIEAYGGYIETGYAYLSDREQLGRSYHNATIAFTRRYFQRISNSVRVIVNAGQDLPEANRTADGGLLLVENSWITATPLSVVPYFNAYYGWGRPQSIARNGLAGGILRNVGINFETDGLNGYPTLDDTGRNTFGGAIGVNLVGANLQHQVVLEAALVQAYGLDQFRNARGNQYGLGARYQRPISNCSLIRFDAMVGWREHDQDLYGVRAEYRYKF